MARKQHEIIFSLGAHSDSSFSSTFQSAQKEVAAFQKEIDQVNRLVGDISAYQKQQAALDNTQKKLDALNAKHDILQKEMQQTETYAASLNTQMEQAKPDTKAYQELQKELRSTEKYYASLQEKSINQEEQIRRTDVALTGQSEKLGKMKDALEEAGVDAAHLTEEEKRLAAESERLKAQQEAVADSAGGMGDSLEGAYTKAQALRGAYEALRPALDAVTGFLGDSIRTAAGFEESMSTVEALTGATAGEMEQLSALAKELGATTKFTAKESADAMGYMGMAGWTAQQMISGLPGVMSLAAASGEDLAMVSNIVTDSLSGFGLKAEDAGHYADILAAAATNANTNVSLMGETFQYAASLAGTLKISAEDTAESVGIMANAGIKGGQAGTALRSILSRLATDAGASSTKLGALGVLTEQLGVDFYDAEENVRDFTDVLDDARVAWKCLTAEEQTSYGKMIAGQYALSGWLTLMNATDDEIQKVRTSIQNCSGAAEQMAAVKLNNFNGQITLMNSAWEALKTTIGEQFLPVGKSAAGVLTDMLTATNDFAREHEDLVRFLSVSVGAFAGLITVLGGAAVAVTALKAAFVALNLSNPIGWISALVGLAVAAGGAIATMAHEVDGVRGAEIRIAKSLDESTKSYQEAAAAIDAEKTSVLNLSRQLQDLSGKSEKTAADQELIADLCDKLNQAVPGLSLAYDKQNDSIIGLNGSLDAYVENLYKAKQRQEDLSRMEDLYGSIQETEKALADANAELEELQGRANNPLEIRGNFGMTQSEVDEVNLMAVIARLKEQLETLQGEYDSLKDSINDAEDAQQKMADDSGAVAEKIATAKEQLDGLRDAYNEAYEAAKKSVEGQFQLWDTAEKADAMNLGDVMDAMQSQIDYWNEYNNNLQKLSARTDEIEGLSDALKYLGNEASPKNVSLVAGMVDATDDDLKEMVVKLQKLQEEQDTTEKNLAEMVTDAGNQMEELSRKTAEEIEKMDLSTEAATAAANTIDAYINTISSRESQAAAAAGRISGAVEAALNRAQAKADAAVARLSATTASMYHPQGSGGRHSEFAVGTKSAPPGWSLVGEQGRELVFFGGSASVPTPQEIRSLREELLVLNRAAPLYRQEPGRTERNQAGQFPVDLGAGPLAAERIRETDRAFERITREIQGVTKENAGGMLVGQNGPELLYFTGGETVLTASETQNLQRETALLSETFRDQLVSVETAREYEELTRMFQDSPAEWADGTEETTVSRSYAIPFPDVSYHGEAGRPPQTGREKPSVRRSAPRQIETVHALAHDAQTLREMERIYRETFTTPGRPGTVPAEIRGPQPAEFRNGENKAPSVLTASETRERESNLLRELISSEKSSMFGFSSVDRTSSTSDSASALRAEISTSSAERELLEAERIYRENRDILPLSIPGYAAGTRAAASGAALVGTHGPELAVFQGGEKVLTARETRDFLRETNLLREMIAEKSALFGFSSAGDSFSTFQTETNATETERELLEAERIYRENRDILPLSIPGYAVGTRAAASGAALVGEQGQELVLWGQPEKAMDSREIRELRERIALNRYVTERTSQERELLEVQRALMAQTAPTMEAAAMPPPSGSGTLNALLGPPAREPLEAELGTPMSPGPGIGHMGGGSYTIHISPSYTNYFQGETKQEDVERAMLANNDNLRELFFQFYEDMMADRARGDFR